MKRPVCLAIIGSRNYENYLAFKQCVAEACAKWDIEPARIVSGGASGVDAMAATWAKKNNIPLTVYAPEQEGGPMQLSDDEGDADDPVVRPPLSRKAFLECNQKIVDDADYIIAFPANAGSGTQHAL